MSNYPKMLYKGNKSKYEYQTASNEESEKELIDSGWVVFGELPEREPGVAGGSVSEINPSAFVPVEHFDALGEENTKLKEELVGALKENQELRKQIRFKELEDKPADELKAILDGAEIKYKANAGKAELAQLVLDHESQAPKN
ncbi:hypothetical protein [Acinetobacter pseudolwoffii]|uniref:hypothetical protein n=1 Tax=Acinetobacter pseudolwoffii TaxID=2053287 RepID=UPI000C24FDE8|nr:hypothetical protein [Acinetobacter pseudolwoffii]PJI34337.1 hypothetical protein CU318_12395 [Acinetobacter pseudolwoffii]